MSDPFKTIPDTPPREDGKPCVCLFNHETGETLQRCELHHAMFNELSKRKIKTPGIPVTVQAVKDLRERTGRGLISCKVALQNSNGDVNAAVDYLRKH